MLVGMKKICEIAKENHFGVPALFASNEHSFKAAIKSAEVKNSPLIVLANYGMIGDIDLFGKIAIELAKDSAVPVSIILDHGQNFEEAVKAVRAGFTDVMIDKSSCPFEENLAEVKKVVEMAHSVGVGVEAEFGHVGQGDNYAVDGHQAFTVPSEAKRFVEESGCDYLAVAIGTAHGVYKGVPEIHFDLLQELRITLDIPMVLHGGSGTGDENLSRACREGICKVNLANDLYRSAANELINSDISGSNAYYIYETLEKGYVKSATHYMDVCGSADKKGLYL